jgi:hypothetical protein
MKNAAKKVEATPVPNATSGQRSERRVKTAREITGDIDRRGLALAMVDALQDILRHEQSGRAA